MTGKPTASTSAPVLLDTHILLYWLNHDRRLKPAQRRALAALGPENPALVSDISLWEVATLVELGRVRLQRPIREWLEAAVAPPLVQRVPISPAIAGAVAALPDSFHRDPADRIIVATAQIMGATLMTLDARILQSALVPTL